MGGPAGHQRPDPDWRETLAIAPVVAVLIALGFFPKPLLDVINPAVDATMQQVDVQDPTPPHPVAEEAAP